MVKVEVINVDVVVTDRSGKSVAGLAREDFEVRLDGRPIEITNFYSESRQTSRDALPAFDVQEERDSSFRPVEEVQTNPRRSHVVVLVDHTRLRASNRKRAFNALRQMVDGLDEDALVSVVGVEGGLVFYSDFLFDREAVHRTFDRISKISLRTDVLAAERRLIFGELNRGISGGIQARASLANEPQLQARIQAYAAQEYARGIRTLQQIEKVVGTLSGIPGRRTLIYVGEGVPTRPGEGLYVEFRNRFAGPERGLPHYDFNTDYTREIGRYDLTEPMRKLAKSANRAGVTLYSIDAEASHGGEIRSALTEQGAFSEAISIINENYREPLEYASKATGGRLLQSSGQLAKLLENLVGDLQTVYSLGFNPPEGWEPGSEKNLEVRVQGKGLRVSHPEEVFRPKPDEREAGATVAALMYQTVDNPLEIRANPGLAAPRDDGAAVLPINIEIPISKLDLLPRDGIHAGSLSIYVSTKDAEGNPGSVQKVPFHLNIPEDKLEEARANAAHYPLPLLLRKGDRQVAIGVRDNNSGLFSAVRLDIAEHSQQL